MLHAGEGFFNLGPLVDAPQKNLEPDLWKSRIFVSIAEP